MNPDASAETDPAQINGDLPLTRAQFRAYIAHHRARNRDNHARSRRLGIRTMPVPLLPVDVGPDATPSRVMVTAFFDMAARRLAPYFRDRDVTMLDLGCGSGAAVLPSFERAGFRGRYIGLDIAAHRKFTAQRSRAFTRELVVTDVHSLDPATLPPVDLLVSATALEHIRDDARAIAKLESRLAPGSAQAHYVPGESALNLYLAHGWRQYSPACVRGLFPHAEIYRAGGMCSNALHLATITRAAPGSSLRESHPRTYTFLRRLSMIGDRVIGNAGASMYAALVLPPEPAGSATIGARLAA